MRLCDYIRKENVIVEFPWSDTCKLVNTTTDTDNYAIWYSGSIPVYALPDHVYKVYKDNAKELIRDCHAMVFCGMVVHAASTESCFVYVIPTL